MVYTNLLPRTVNITGSDCTGSDGDSNRTYTLPDVGVLESGMDIAINGTTLHEGAGNDFTISGSVITFLNPVDDTDVIRINYWIETGAAGESVITTTTSLRYATPEMLGDIIGIINDVPSWDVAGSPTNEEVGTGDNSETIFYLDQQNVVSDSETFYYGADATATDELTETTHYTLENDTGKITLTSAGVTLVDTNKIYAKYRYFSDGMKNSHMIAVLGRAEEEVDLNINSTITNGATANAAYPLEIEEQASEGIYVDRIITGKKPLYDAHSELDGDIAIDDATITLVLASGFPSEGYVIIGSEIITYTGVTSDNLTGCSRGVLDSTAATHSNTDSVHSTVVRRSDTTEGTEPAWTVQSWDTHIHATENGLIYKYEDASPDPLTKRGVANRIQIIYLYGYSELSVDISRLTLLFAKRQLMQDTVGKAIIAGRNEFRPEMVNVDDEEIKRIINKYIVFPMGNT
jgi:hypothetical protein